MAPITFFEAYNLVIGSLTAIGLLYLLYSQRFVLEYRRFLTILFIGFLLFSIGGPLADLFAPDWAHLVHGVAAMFAILGLYDPVHNDLRTNDWAKLLFRDPGVVRDPAEWMVSMDEEILELFHSTDLVLSPSIIAYNLDYSREAVSRRLGKLCEHGFAEKVERGRYRMTEFGEQYYKLYPETVNVNNRSRMNDS